MTSYTDIKRNSMGKEIIRKLAVSARRAGNKVKDIAKVFGVSRKFVWKWSKRAHHRGTESFRDRKRRHKEPKVTPQIEEFVLFLRVVFGWGTGRIQNGLISMPPYMYEKLPDGITYVSELIWAML